MRYISVPVAASHDTSVGLGLPLQTVSASYHELPVFLYRHRIAP